MKRLIRRILSLLAIVLLLPAIIVGTLGSGELVSPDRRALQDYHRNILAGQDDHGLQVTDDEVSGTPIQIYKPSKNPGTAEKSRALRQILTNRGITQPTWGETVATIVMLHGHKGRKEDHLPIAERFCAAGFACISIDLPGHGDNPDARARFGKRETRLIDKIVQSTQTKHQLPTPTALFGISQGGAIALQAAAQHPENYYAVTSIASFTTLQSVLQRNAINFGITNRPIAGYLLASVRIGTLLRAGFDPVDISPIEAAGSITIPTLIGHGANDQYIPPESAQALFDQITHQNKEIHLISKGTHDNVLAVGGNEFYADIATFFLSHLPTPW